MDHTSAIVLAVVSLLTIAFAYDRATRGILTRLVAERAPKSRFELVPAKKYDTPARADGVDIIFVHGLESNPDTTWRAKRCKAPPDAPEETRTGQSDVTWVSDFLPEDLPDDRRDVRLFFYNYDSYWKRDSLDTRRAILGKELLGRIKDKIRATEADRKRNLIFVAYSYGGLVVKQALVRAQVDPDFSYIVEATKAVLFLGTPHRGSAFSGRGQIWAHLLRPLGSNPSLLADIDYDSTSLLDLHDDFVRINGGNLSVCNFYEQRPVRLAQFWFLKWQEFCVREASATYSGPRVHNIGLPVDHFDLNRFGSRDENYQSILSKLAEATSSLTASAKCHYSVPLETVESYTERESLWSELAEKMHIRHDNASVPYACVITGLGGAGKSQLALKYAETHKDRYSPILWIDATDAESLRSSFQRCAVELELPPSKWSQDQRPALADDTAIQAVLQWLRDRSEADDEWLVIVDNADDLSVGIKQIMPKGERGSVIITSRDELSLRLISRGCEQIQIGDMSSEEATTLLLHHLGDHIDAKSEAIAEKCRQVADNLGYLALAVDLAGAYISADSDPATALTHYLDDFSTHRDELLQMDAFRGLRPIEKTVWTVWDTTLRKITSDNQQLRPDLLLTLLAHFKGTIIQDEVFRLASLGMAVAKARLGDELSPSLQEFFRVDEGKWDDYQYRQSYKVLLRYHILKRVDGDWPGLTTHGLVKWRAAKALSDEEIQQWHWSHTLIILAVCIQITEESHRPEFRQHLMVHLPPASELCGETGQDIERDISFFLSQVSQVYYDQGSNDEAEKLDIRALAMRKERLGADHPDTLSGMANLASTYRYQGRWDEAERLQVEVLATRKEKLGADHPDTLISMNNLAWTWHRKGRHDEALALMEDCVQARQRVLGLDHPHTLSSLRTLEIWR